MDYPEDVARIVGAMNSAGLGIVPEDAENLWYYYSDTQMAGWLCLPTNDSDIVAAITRAAFMRHYSHYLYTNTWPRT